MKRLQLNWKDQKEQIILLKVCLLYTMAHYLMFLLQYYARILYHRSFMTVVWMCFKKFLKTMFYSNSVFLSFISQKNFQIREEGTYICNSTNNFIWGNHKLNSISHFSFCEAENLQQGDEFECKGQFVKYNIAKYEIIKILLNKT